MKNIIAFIIVLILFAANASPAQTVNLYPDVKVIESDDRGITLEFMPEYLFDEKISSENELFVLPRFKNGDYLLNTVAGSPDIRARVIQLALPGISGNTLSVIASDFETINNVMLAPVPEVELIDDLGARKKKYKSSSSLQEQITPQVIATLSNPGTVKGWYIANLIVAPYQYVSSLKSLYRYKRIVIRVDFGVRSSNTYGTTNDEWARASVINYHEGKRWNSLSLKKTSAISSVLKSGSWYKLEITEEGMYRINATYLRSLGIDPASLTSMFDLKVFGSDGKAIPENINASRPPDLPQMAVRYVDKNSNGKFDSDDFIMFYGQGTTGWNYDPVQRDFHFYSNTYTNSNYYFLAIGANAPVRSIAEKTVLAASSGKVTETLGKVFFKEEKFNFTFSGQNWVSAPFNPGDSRVISNRLHGWKQGSPVRYVYHLYSRSNVNTTFAIEESGVQIASPVLPLMSDFMLNYPATIYAQETQGSVTVIPTLTDQRSNVKFTYQASSAVASGYIDWIKIFFRQQLTALNDQFIFNAPDTSGIVEFEVNGFSNTSLTDNISVFDVTAINDQKKIAHQTSQMAGIISFKDSSSAGISKKYWIGAQSTMKIPRSFRKIGNSDLHGSQGAEFIIITHSDFKSEAVRLKQHKETLPNPLSTIVVDIDTLFNEFGIGMPDPVSMRDFIKHAYDNWSVKPGYVLFFGDATFDSKNILGNDKWWVPTIQTAESNNKISTYNYEDFFAYLNPNNPVQVSIAHGRLCPRTSAEARLLVDRIIAYETSGEKSTWKNLLTIVADDMWTPENQTERDHLDQSESLIVNNTPKDFEIKRIYLEEYATVFSSSGRRKPDARRDMLDQINKGTLILNYIGHGNPKVWAHEAILSLDDVKTQFKNPNTLTFIVAATCDWGRFEEGTEQSSAEEVMVNKNGGAIGVLSATRAVYSHSNAELNQRFYNNLFSGAPLLRLGDALMLTKNLLADLENKQKYFLLGDPTLRLAVPSEKISIDSINSKTTAVTDTIRALQKVIITGSVRLNNNAINTNYNGTALVTVFDSEINRSITAVSGFTYKQPGAVIYKGEASIKNGILNATFIVPKDITYENKNGRISIYFSNTSSDGRGYTTNFVVGGTNGNAPVDSTGPSIVIYFDSPSYRSGDLIGNNPVLFVDLKDSSGINSSGSAIGHRIEAWIDGSSKSIDLTNSYKGKIDSYQEGTVQYPLTDLSVGSHTMKVRAWDVYNNSSMEETFFVVATGEGLSIRNLYNFPNPVSTTTAFTFQHNQLMPIDITINIYTVAGRLIHRIEKYGFGERFVRVPWDRRDSDGDEVGNGIYFYRVIARTIDGKYTSESTGKMAIVR